MKLRRLSAMCILAICSAVSLPAQVETHGAGRWPDLQGSVDFFDKCGYDPKQALAMLQKLGSGWGYNYDSLLTDLQTWQQSPFVRIDSAGASVQNRALWMLTITDTSEALQPRIRVWMHARTHPNEVQAWWVTDEIISLLLSDTPLARMLRKACIFNIMPMYNPDGVELGKARWNAHGVDIESNWDKNTLEPEVKTLKALFEGFMVTESPIRVALNMHSAYRCKRFFVYHDANGTSPAYAADEKVFIGNIRYYWPEGIQPWYEMVTWTQGPGLQYPEGWFWSNHREAVMALTYEDMNCDTAGEYDRTADAMLRGIADYLGIGQMTSVTRAGGLPESPVLRSYPNPLPAGARMRIQLTMTSTTAVRIGLYDLLGRELTTVFDGRLGQGEHSLTVANLSLPAGIYFVRLNQDGGSVTQPFTVIR